MPKIQRFDDKVIDAISDYDLSTATVTSSDKVLLQDADDNDQLKTSTAQAIADLSGGAGAPDDAQYITLATDGTLTNERVITPGNGIEGADAGAGSTYTLAANINTTNLQFTTGEINTIQDITTTSSPTFSAITINGNITVAGTVDGRDLATDGTKLDGIESGADVTDETNVTDALDGATLTAATVATDDKVLLQDTNDSDTLKTATAQSIADLAGAGYILLSTATASNSSTLEFTSDIDSTYNSYAFVIDIIPATDNVALFARTSTNGGSSYDSGSTDYTSARVFCLSNVGTATGAGADADYLNLLGGVGSDTGETVAAVLYMINPANSSSYTLFHQSGVTSRAGGELAFNNASLRRNSTTAVDAVQFYFSSGNIESGTIKMYGLL